MKALFIVLAFFCITPLCSKSQTNKIKSEAASFDFFNYKYKYLDKSYKITMSSKEFEKSIQEYKFYKDRINTYKDSLSVVLMAEFKDWSKVNSGTFQLTYTWQRLSYHLWLSEKESKAFATKLNFKHPYLFNQYLMSQKSNENKLVLDFFRDLKKKLSFDYSEELKSKTTNLQILNFAMQKSKKRMDDFSVLKYQEKHGTLPPKDFETGKGCGKEDCCQKK